MSAVATDSFREAGAADSHFPPVRGQELARARTSFAKKLRILRTEMDMSQGELAGAVGVQASTVSGWERGRFRPRLDTAGAIVDLAKDHGLDGQAHELLEALVVLEKAEAKKRRGAPA